MIKIQEYTSSDWYNATMHGSIEAVGKREMRNIAMECLRLVAEEMLTKVKRSSRVALCSTCQRNGRASFPYQ